MRVYRASEIGGCLKAQIAKHLGYEPMDPPDEFRVRFAEGDLHEEAVISTLMDMGYEIFDRQEAVQIPINTDSLVEGHIDGTVINDVVVKQRILEVKSMSEAEFKKFEEKLWEAPGLIQRYKWQLSCYMIAKDMEALVVAKNRNTGQLKFVGVEIPFYNIDEIRARVLECEDWVGRDQLPAVCDTINYPCGFFYLHQEEEPEEDGGVDYTAVRKAAANYLSCKKSEEMAKELTKLARDELLKTIGDRDKVKDDVVSVTYYDYSTVTLDRRRMESDGIDVAKYERKTVSKRLRVKLEEKEGQVDPSH